MPRELAACVERANLDPEVHVIALAGNGKGFCGGYDLVACAEGTWRASRSRDAPAGSPLDPMVQAAQPRPRAAPGTRSLDYQMMCRNVRGFMSLFHSDKPVVCKVHGFCVAGGTDMALCSDLLVIEDRGQDRLPAGARLGRADDGAVGASGSGRSGPSACCSPATRSPAPRRSSGASRPRRRPPAELDERFEALLERIARMPVNQLVMQKLLVNQALYAQGLQATQMLGTFFDGIARHTPRATRSSGAPPRPASSRRCASATSRSARLGRCASPVPNVRRR